MLVGSVVIDAELGKEDHLGGDWNHLTPELAPNSGQLGPLPLRTGYCDQSSNPASSFHLLMEVEAELCAWRSIAWLGPCSSSLDCNSVCLESENATHGACGGYGFDCICFFNCTNY
ncbi:unnamed protein product [Trifolium pratense]|uniref:Uncharacterized protein n=1 Tax=Trifolium pratense TaxID=57577 RepID=A0ACB0ISR1_TRIPR|nr:unnamed protein product [Trifolium pratense]